MILRSLVLQNFRSYIQSKFDFSDDVTMVIGPNTTGKTNLADAIHLLATGKSSKGLTDVNLINFGKEIGRVKGLIEYPVSNVQYPISNERITVEVVLMTPQYNNGRFGKKYLVNGIPKSRMNFLGFLPLVLFRPEELDIIIDGPSIRRDFLNEILEQVDKAYVTSLLSYERSLKQRNALLHRAKEEGYRNEKQFAYWDELLISHGQVLTKNREALINWINNQEKEIIDFSITYDMSLISEERLFHYRDVETSAGVTLVGPHRDDFFIELPKMHGEKRDVRIFGSRGQQRLMVLQLKLLQIQFMTEKLGEKPLLVLDDIFSELDSKHIQLVLDHVSGQQAIITTTHREFIPKKMLRGFSVIELNHNS